MKKLNTFEIVIIIIAIIIILWILLFMGNNKNRFQKRDNSNNCRYYSPSNQTNQLKQISYDVPNNSDKIYSPASPLQYDNTYNTYSNFNEPFVNQNGNEPINSTNDPYKIQNSSFTVYYFYSPKCGWCQKFTPTWNNIVTNMNNNNDIKFLAINAEDSNNENLMFYHNVNKFPSIIVVTPNKNIEYSGNRSYNDLYEFIIKSTNK